MKPAISSDRRTAAVPSQIIPTFLLCGIVWGISFLCALGASAQGTAFTHQGRLDAGGSPATGAYDLQFSIFTAPTGGTRVAGPTNILNVAVAGGVFTLRLDFGPDPFNGQRRWLEMGVKPGGSGGAYTTLSPRQELTPTPYAMFAETASFAYNAGFASTANGVTPNAVGPAGLANGSVTSAKIADGTIVGADLSPSLLGNTFWKLTGNAGTSPGVNFLGTTDNQAVEIKVNNRRILRLEPDDNVIGGQFDNQVTPGVAWATIAGGQEHLISADSSTISGGSGHVIQSSAFSGVIAGGYRNQLSLGANNSVISGGAYNLNSAAAGTISGGRGNTIQSGSAYAIIGGGEGHSIGSNGTYSTISGGNFNAATAHFATIPGGRLNLAGGDYSFAAGRRAKAYDHGSFVWADSTDADFSSARADELAIRAAGGVRIQSNRGLVLNAADTPLITRGFDPFDVTAPAAKAGLGRWGLFMEPHTLVLGMPGIGFKSISFGKYAANGAYTSLAHVEQDGTFRTAGAVNPPSDRNVKQDFEPVDSRMILERVTALPLQTWTYTNNPAVRHIGPVAQDFHAAFGVGTDDKHIATVDADGVALAAIQGLNQKVEEQLRQMTAKDDRVTALETTVKQLQAALEQLVRSEKGGAR